MAADKGYITYQELLRRFDGGDVRPIYLFQGPENFLVILGCAGWGPGQLEMEIKENSWLTCPGDEEIIFKLPHEGRWATAVKKLGIDPASLTDFSGHA